MEDKLLTLHGNLIKEGFDIPDAETFRNDMSDPEKSKRLHDSLLKEGYDLPEYDTFLNDMGIKKKNPLLNIGQGTGLGASEVSETSLDQASPSVSESTEKPKKETSVIGDLARSLKSSSLRALGGISATPALLTKTAQSVTMKPLMRAMGATEEEANATLDYINTLNTFGQTSQLGEEAQKSFNKVAQKTEAKMTAIEGNIVQNIQDGNWGKAGELVARGVVQSVPYLAMTAATAGGGTPAVLTTIGATSAAQQYGELEGVKEPKRILNSWLYGGFEAAGELVTAGILNGVGRAFKQGASKTVQQNFVKGLSKELAKNFLGEASSEGATQIGQNITDIITGVDPNKKVFDNVLDASIIGGVAGGGLTGVQGGSYLVGRAMASKKEVQQVQDNFNQQKVLIDQIESTDSDPVKKALESRLQSLQAESNELMDENVRIAENLSPAEQNKIAELFSVQDELQAKIDNGEVTKEEVPVLESTIQGIEDEIQTIKENFLTAEEEALKAKEKGETKTEVKAEEKPQETQVEKPAKVPFTEINAENIAELEKNTLSSIPEEEQVDVKSNLELIKQSVNERAERERNPLAVPTEDRTGEISVIRPEEITGDAGALEGIFRGRRDGNRGARVTPEEQVAQILAPNGQKSNLSPELHAYVRTPEFKAKFGDWQAGDGSLVLDRNGEPMVVYSGKGKYHIKGLDPTKTQQKILFFTGDRLLAKDYAQFGGKQPVIYRGFVRISDTDLQEGSKINNLHEGQQEFITTKKEQFIPIGVEEVPKVKKGKAVQGELKFEETPQEQPSSIETPNKPVLPPNNEESPVESSNIPPEPPIAQKQAKTGENEEKFRGAQVNALIRDASEGQKVIKEAVERNREKYTVLHGEVAIENAKAHIDNLGIEGATADLIEKTRDFNEFPIRQVARLVLLDSYSRLLADKTATEVDRTKAYNAIDKLQTALAREATSAGQGNAMLQLWTTMQPAGVLEYVIRKTAEFNQKKLNKKLGDTTVGQQLDDLYNTLSEANKKVIDEILNGKELSSILQGVVDKSPQGKEKKAPVKKDKTDQEKEKVPRIKRRTVAKEVIQKEKDYRKNLLSQYKATNKSISASVVGLSKEQIELGGNLLASYIRQGAWQLVDAINTLREDFKTLGINLDDKQVNAILNLKKSGNQTFRSWMREQEAQASIRKNMKSMGLVIQDVIKEHWTKKDELGRTLAQKFVDEAGVSDKEAKQLEKLVLDQYQALIKEKAEQQLAKTLGSRTLPTKGKDKVLLDKMFDAMNMGALDSEFYGELFADKFGLLPKLQQEEMAEIMRLANIVQQTSDMGWFNRDATIALTKYIYERYPQKRLNEVFNTWIAMAYSNMLMGFSTSVLNLWSAGTNMAFRPFRDVTNLSKWISELRKGKNADFYNPFGEMVYAPALRGIAYGAQEAKEVYKNGDLNNKYVEDISQKSKFNVTPLERNKYGEAKRFKPFTVKIAGKTVDFNILNFYKYSGRNLSAQDKMMLNTAYDMEIASILRDVIREKENLKGRALTKRVMEIYKGTHVDFEALGRQVEQEAAKYKELSGKEITDLQRRIRLKELERAQLPLTAEEKADAEKLARSNIFTDQRGGLIATLTNAIGYAANSNPVLGMIIKPFVPFTRVVGNVSEYMFDYTPFYGFMRARFGGISALKKLIDSDYETAQMGEKGSKAYYEQMGRAWFGTISFSLAMISLLGTDEDDYIQITGGYNLEGFEKAGRTNVTPKYTLRIGKVEIPYQNVPVLAIPLALVGNLNDGIRQKKSDEEMSARLAVALSLDAVAQTVIMMKDMAVLDGMQNMFKMFADATSMEAGAWESVGKTLARTYIGFASRPLPQNNNAVQQVWKVFDPTSYSQKEISSLLEYAAGIQHFTGTPAIDQLGDEIKSYPGETLMPYTHWANLRGEDERWKFLVEHNAIPTKIANKPILIETEDGIEQRSLEEDELYEYTLMTGQMFSQSLQAYMKDKEKVSKRMAETVTVKDGKGQEILITGIQDDIQTMWENSRKDARTALFYWGEVKENMPKEWDIIAKNKAYQPYLSSKKVDGKALTKDQLYRFNTIASTYYAPMVAEYLKSDYVKFDKQDIVDEETGQTAYDKELKDLWQIALEDAEADMEDVLWAELEK